MSFLKVVADFEAYYCSKSRYSLRVMDIPSYILDPRFEEIGCAFKIDGQPTQWVDGPHVGGYLKRLKELSRDVRRPIMFINHNTPFDGSIASWRHGFVADCYVDTLAMSRALLGYKLARNDLDSVARYLKVGSKGTTIHKVNGMRRQDIINAGIYDEYAAYSCLDSDLCWGIFNILFPVMPVSETAITDMVLRMAIEPSLKLEPALLQEHLAQVRAEKDALLAEAGFDMSTEETKQAAIDSLMSNDRFADVLRTLNVSPPKKVSPTTGQVTYAFAKTDDGMKDLLEHPDLAVQAVVGARLGVKSTIEETRTERFLNISTLTFPAYGTNLFPIALKVSGAHTHRLSGDWRLNQQNMSRPSRKRPRAMLRESIVAPDGYTILAGDESQIEARLTALFCGQMDLVQEFAQGGDPYSSFASKIFGFPVSKATPGPRFCGKTCLALDTKVLTERGWVSITSVTTTDKLWDGVEWVSHDGLIFQGYKSTTKAFGLDATPDHEILTEAGLVEWSLVRTNKSLFQSALSLVNLPSQVTSQCERPSVAVQDGTQLVCVSAAGKALSKGKASGLGAQRNAIHARKYQPTLNGIGNTAMQWPTTATVAGFSQGSTQQSTAAITQKTAASCTTGAEALPSHKNGVTTARRSSGISRLCRGGMTPHSTWTERKTTAGTRPETSASLAAARTTLTSAKFRTSKHVSENLRPVFDIVNAGPRHRFTVWTDSGPVIVSNCVLAAGFGVGWRRYQASIKHLSKEQLGTALVLTDDEAQNHIALYRDDKPYIAKMWRYLNDVVIPAMTRVDCDFMLGPVRVMYEKIVLPNGLCLHYRGLHRDAQSGDWLFVYGNRIKKIYGGMLLENIIQALARVVIMDAALRLRPVMATLGAKLVMQVHDELVYLVPVAMIEFAEHYLKQELTRCPVWMPGLPLACETGKDRSYGQAK